MDIKFVILMLIFLLLLLFYLYFSLFLPPIQIGPRFCALMPRDACSIIPGCFLQKLISTEEFRAGGRGTLQSEKKKSSAWGIPEGSVGLVNPRD